MYIAQYLRKENIAEYLLYMWQVEDIIRAYDCNLSRVKDEYIGQFAYSDEQKEELTDWYGDLVRMMNQEGCRERGHLQINKLIVQQLIELHVELIDSPKYPFYHSEYYKVLPFIVELRNRGAHKDEHEIETCLNALYGVMVLRLQKKEITPVTDNAIKEITTFIGMLSDYFQKGIEEEQ